MTGAAQLQTKEAGYSADGCGGRKQAVPAALRIIHPFILHLRARSPSRHHTDTCCTAPMHAVSLFPPWNSQVPYAYRQGLTAINVCHGTPPLDEAKAQRLPR